MVNGRSIHTLGYCTCLLALAGCSNQPSALNPAGDEASSIRTLFITMSIGAALVWIIVIGLMVYAFRQSRRSHHQSESQTLILWGGAVFPTVTLAALLAYALWLMPNIRPWHGGSQAARIEVTGEQYWWRVRYLDSGGQVLFETANEVRLPLGSPTTFSLRAKDVIHSFWIPALGGKMDMIPGRTNFLTLTPTRPGIYRGPCAEFCGTSHALMNLTARVMPKDEYDAWLVAARRQPALEHRGAQLFVAHGCTACHAVEGVTAARTSIGPNLTLLGERQTIGAGTLANSADEIARFIRDPAAIKPGATMPAFDMLPEGDIEAIADWLGGHK